MNTTNSSEKFHEKFLEVEQKKKLQVKKLIKTLYEIADFKIFHDTTVEDIKKHQEDVKDVCKLVHDTKKIVEAYKLALELKYELEKNETVC